MPGIRHLALGSGSLAWVYDTWTGTERINRSLRTFKAGIETLIDYRFRFDAGNVEEMHEVNAERWYTVCMKNKGLYIKIGQGIASMNHILPKQYRDIFEKLQDKADSMPHDRVEKIIEQDLGCSPRDLFDTFDPEPLASASIAQVHRATLSDGTPVAVKIQKDHIAPQMPFDFFCQRVVTAVLEYVFEIPMLWTLGYTQDHIRKELDFRIEADNARAARLDLASVNRIHVPIVYKHLTSRNVMVMEWIDGTKVTDMEGLKKLGVSTKDLMTTIVQAFSEQTFISGRLHCDPHPGNLFVRADPSNKRDYQLVIIDHGMYIQQRESFRRDNCRLWKAMILADRTTLESICTQWGIRNADMFSSFQLFRPYTSSKPLHRNNVTKEELLEMHLNAKQQIKTMLSNAELTPPELIFIGRSMNFIRALNKDLGSPINRIDIMSRYAVRGIHHHSHQTLQDSAMQRKMQSSFSQRMRGRLELILFETNMMMINTVFHLCQLWRLVVQAWSGRDIGSFEDQLEEQMKHGVERMLGLELDTGSNGAGFG